MNVVIINVFGVRNKGDQALFSSLLDHLRAGERCVKITAVTNAEYESRDVFPDVEFVAPPWVSHGSHGFARRAGLLHRGMAYIVTDCILRLPRSKMSRALMSADLVVSCPGGFLEDSNWSYIAHMTQIWAASRVFGKKVLMAPQSIGPIRSIFWCAVLGRVLQGVDSVFVRERYSYDFCVEKLKVESSKIVRSRDMAILNRRFRVTRVQAPEVRVVGITFVGWEFYGDRILRGRYLAAMRGVVSGLLEAGIRVVVIPQTADTGRVTDSEMAHASLVGLPVEYLSQSSCLDHFLAYFDRIDLLIGSRLHSCLLALGRGCPTISISYLPKCRLIMEELGLSEFVVDIEDVDADNLRALLKQLMGLDARERYIASLARSYSSEVDGFREVILRELSC